MAIKKFEDMSRIVAITIDEKELVPWQPPGVTVLEGDPKGRAYLLHDENEGKGFLVGVFACDPAKTTYELISNETTHILEGEVRIELDNGDGVDLKPGDVAMLPKGHLSTWTFKKPFKEFFILSN
jgi:uncharacterized protein